MRLFLYLSILLPFFAKAQEIEVVPIAQKSLTIDRFIGVDEYKNLYFINGNVFHKQTAKKDFQYSDLQLGTVTSVDIINPLRITLFYEKVNMAVILDNALNEITRVDFNQLENFKNVTHARTASDRRLWIFNSDLRQVELFDYRNNSVRVTSPPLPDPVMEMASNFNTCWVYTGKKLQAFNNYGSLIYTLAANDLERIRQFRDHILAIKNGKLVTLNKVQHDFIDVNLDEKELDQLFWTGEILYIYNGNSLSTYNLKLPKN